MGVFVYQNELWMNLDGLDGWWSLMSWGGMCLWNRMKWPSNKTSGLSQPVAGGEHGIHRLAAKCATTELTRLANFLSTWTPSTYALDCSSNVTSPLLEWRTQLMWNGDVKNICHQTGRAMPCPMNGVLSVWARDSGVHMPKTFARPVSSVVAHYAANRWILILIHATGQHSLHWGD